MKKKRLRFEALLQAHKDRGEKNPSGSGALHKPRSQVRCGALAQGVQDAQMRQRKKKKRRKVLEL